MDIGSLLLVFALLVLVALFVARPVLEQHSAGVSPEEQQLSTALADQDQLLDALQELDFDFHLGKIPEEEYPLQRARLLEKGATIMQRLDSLQGRPAAAPADIELALASRRAPRPPILGERFSPQGWGPGGLPRHTPRPPDDDLETLIASRRRTRAEKSAGFCPQCGHPAQESDRFCGKCGNNLI